MLMAVKMSGEYISAAHAKPEEAYYCPACMKPVLLKRGRYKIAHFSHQSLHECYKARKESAAHLSGKHLLFQMFRNNDVRMEYYIDEIEQIPDVMVGRYIFELQLSIIPVDLILHRTYGYQSIGKEVYWITDETALKEGQQLTAFQRALIHSTNTLLSFDSMKQLFYIYYIKGLDQQLNVVMERYVFNSIDQLVRSELEPRYFRMSSTDKAGYIRRCRARKSVLEPTLSALYQLGIDAAQLPDYIGIIVPMQYYVKTHPIAWQSRLLQLISTNQFTLSEWSKELEFYHYNFQHFSKRDIALQLVSQYQTALSNNCVQI